MPSPVTTSSCVIASYRYGHLAAQAIESVLHQTKHFDHVLFVDDGVGDCAHLPEIYPEVEFVLRPENLGTVANFNDALSRVETERVLFLGADNWLHHQCLETVSAVDAEIVSYRAWLIRDGPYELWDPGVPHGSALYDVASARSVGGYVASGNEHTEEDTVMFRRMAAEGARTVLLEDPLLFYRWRHRRNFNIG